MTDVTKHSFIVNTGRKIGEKWKESFIWHVMARDLKDTKINNSQIYRLIVFLLKLLGKFSDCAGQRIDNLISKSLFISFFCSVGKKMACYFKASLICRLIEKIAECEFDFANLKLYQLIVFLIVFISPFAPTMLCAGFAVIALGLYAVGVIRHKSTPHKMSAVGFLILLLIGIFGFFAVFSLAPKNSIKIWFLYTAFMSFFFLITNTVTSKERLYKLAALAVFSGLLVSAYGIYQNFFGDNKGHAWLDDAMFEQITVRVYSTLGNPNVLGEYLLLIIPICSALLWTRKTLISKLYYGGALAAMLLCMVYTQSRGCWLGLILAAAVFAVFVDWRLVAAGAVVMVILPFVLPESIITRFQSIGNVNDSSTSYRLYIWLGTINMLRDFGIYGIGLGSDAFNKIYPFYSYATISAPHSHNVYLQLLCETGIVGLGTFLILMIVCLKKMLLTKITDKKGFCGMVAIAVMSGLIGFLLQGAFDYVWYNYRVFLIFWITIAVGISAGRVMDDKAYTCNQ